MGLKFGIFYIVYHTYILLKSDQNGIEIRVHALVTVPVTMLKSDQNGIEIKGSVRKAEDDPVKIRPKWD